MLIYILNILLTVALTMLALKINNKKIRAIVICLIILFPSILAGIRYGIGNDYLGVYEPIFEGAKNKVYVNRNRNIELGYIAINNMVLLFNGEFPMVMFICSLITNTFFILGIFQYKEKINVSIAVGIYMLIYYQSTYNIVRQMMALSIIFWGYQFLNYDNGKKNAVIGILKYSLCVIIAATFQKSAIIMFSIIILNLICKQNKIKNLKYYIYIIVFIIVINCDNIGNLLASIPQLKYYAGYLQTPNGFCISLGFLIRNIPLILPYFLIRKEIDSDNEFNLQCSIAFIGIILSLLAVLVPHYGERISIYFMVSQMILVPAYIETLRKMNKEILKINTKKYFIVASIIFLCFYISEWYFEYCYMNRSETVPYQMIFQARTKESINE